MIQKGLMLLALILIISFGFSASVEDLPQNTIQGSTQITSIQTEMNLKFSQLNDRLNTFLTKEDLTNLMNQHLNKVAQINEYYRNQTIIGMILSGLALLGGFFGVFFYFKSKGRL